MKIYIKFILRLLFFMLFLLLFSCVNSKALIKENNDLKVKLKVTTDLLKISENGSLFEMHLENFINNIVYEITLKNKNIMSQKEKDLEKKIIDLLHKCSKEVEKTFPQIQENINELDKNQIEFDKLLKKK